jgi:hypothetical protein
VIKTLLIGLWVCAVSLGSTYFASTMKWGSDQAELSPEEANAVEFVKTEMLSVPVIRNGKVNGYVVTQMSFAVNKAELGKLPFEPSPYLVDAAFRAIYQNATMDFSGLRSQDLTALSATMVELANARLGSKLVRDVLINDINYVARDEIRTNWVKKSH